ncbi:cadherin-like protein 26 isoform X2 [Stegostoma tigrinum]|uniref:cadherin-like protein 26 isoform X2 n=1 Tax=Stegostoma tigrinum TaxID=3053191 RepID=UPI00202B9678|nr:cadherin-like protein 26 isoform X2 [Stegostoma tigrinum]
MRIHHILLCFSALVMNSLAHIQENLNEVKNGIHPDVQSIIQNARGLRLGNSKELKPHQLRRCKRAWVLATFEITEEDEGPFPKFVAQLQNDKTQNYSLWYKIMGPGVDQDPERGLFEINKNNGNLYVNRKVDRETTSIFKLTVDALQKRTGNILDSSLIYQIKVKDINDNPPVFSNDIYHVQVSESTAPGQCVFKIEAMDKDEKKHPNSIISYYLVSEPESPAGAMFAIDQENGTITLKNCLDYQKISSYKLLIRARDNGLLIQHSSTATVTINVEDRNNNPPFFASHTASATVSENNVMAVILKVKVSDGDQPGTPGWKAKYAIIHGNEKENYQIETEPDTNNGILLLIKHLDYEHGHEGMLQIAVENEEPLFTCLGTNGEMSTAESQIMTVFIKVLDENDPPVFDPPEMVVKCKEGLLPEVVLGRMNATDPDNIFKNHIRYVKAYDPGELVSVDEVTGVVTTLKALDREAPYMNGSVYDIIIHAVDDGVPPLTGTATLHLHMSDVNDNAPYLVNKNQHICTNGKARSITIMVADDDENPFSGPFTFEILDTKVFGKEMWKLSTAYGMSSQLISLQDPLPGVYAVPFKIYDRQGISNENVLNLRVCHCPDGVTCESLKTHRSVGVGTAIGILFASLLLLLIVSCLFLFCHFTNKMQTNLAPDDKPNGTLIQYNEEGGGVPSSADFILRFLPEQNGHFFTHGFETSGTLRTEDENTYKHKGFFQPSMENLTPVNSSPGYGFNNQNGLENARVQFYNDKEDLQDHCAPHVYMHEGRATSIISLDSLTNPEKRDDFNYLKQLKPKFKTNNEICQ